jgi:hypothetical protein
VNPARDITNIPELNSNFQWLNNFNFQQKI